MKTRLCVWVMVAACEGGSDAPDASADAFAEVAEGSTSFDAHVEAEAEADAGPECNGSTPTVLAMNQASPQGIASDGANVYWTAAGRIEKCAVSGCGGIPTTITSAAGAPFTLVIDAANVYWAHYGSSLQGLGGQVLTCPLTGCTGSPTVLGTGVGLRWVAVDATNVYWIDSNLGSDAGFNNNLIQQCAKTGCVGPPNTLASGQGAATGIVSDGTDVFWTAFNGLQEQLLKCAVTGCANTPTVLAHGSESFYALTFDADAIYLVGNGEILKCAKTGCGTTPTVLAMNNDPFPNGSYGIAVDNDNVYWTDGGYDYAGFVYKCAKSGCAKPTPIATCQTAPWGVAVDGTNVYWTGFPYSVRNDSAGIVSKLPK